MDQHNLHHLHKHKVCELCLKHDPLVKNYEEDYQLQTAVRVYVEKTTGEKINVSDIIRLCDSCYEMLKDFDDDEEEE